jgi:hypothetical protein
VNGFAVVEYGGSVCFFRVEKEETHLVGKKGTIDSYCDGISRSSDLPSAVTGSGAGRARTALKLEEGGVGAKAASA